MLAPSTQTCLVRRTRKGWGLWQTEPDRGSAVSKQGPHLTVPVPLPCSLQTWMSVRNTGMPSAARGGARTAWAPTAASWAASPASTGRPWVTASVSTACVALSPAWQGQGGSGTSLPGARGRRRRRRKHVASGEADNAESLFSWLSCLLVSRLLSSWHLEQTLHCAAFRSGRVLGRLQPSQAWGWTTAPSKLCLLE